MYMSSRYMSHVAHTPPIAWRMTMANHRSLVQVDGTGQGALQQRFDQVRFVTGPGHRAAAAEPAAAAAASSSRGDRQTVWQTAGKASAKAGGKGGAGSSKKAENAFKF